MVLWGVLLLALIMPDGHITTAHAKNVTAKETDLRAAIVLGILRFTRWPNDVEMASDFNLCTYGEPISKQALLQISGVRQINNAMLRVIPIEDLRKELASCNALVIGNNGADKHFNRANKKKHLYGILTICDACRSEHVRAMVYLLRNNNRIGFEIDLAEAKKNGVVFSSALLELAAEVRRQ
jgi:hypothetical protein